MSKILGKLFGNAGGSVVDKLAGVADRFIRTKDEKAEFEKQMTQIMIDAEAACLLYTSPSPRDRG